MARSQSQRERDKGEYRRNRDILLAGQPRDCMLCHGRRGPLLYEDDIGGERWWLHKLAATADHIIPVVEGGSHALSNLRPAHRSCNSKRNKVMVAQAQLPRRIRDFGRPSATVYGTPGRAAPHGF